MPQAAKYEHNNNRAVGNDPSARLVFYGSVAFACGDEDVDAGIDAEGSGV